MLVLALAGVATHDVAADYLLSNDCLPDRGADDFLTREGPLRR